MDRSQGASHRASRRAEGDEGCAAAVEGGVPAAAASQALTRGVRCDRISVPTVVRVAYNRGTGDSGGSGVGASGDHTSQEAISEARIGTSGGDG